MKYRPLHNWNVTPREAVAIQADLAKRIILHNDFAEIKTVAGADICLDPKKEQGIGGVIVYRYPDWVEIERVSAICPLTFPYIPGLLSFREGPVLLKAFEKLQNEPDLIIFDGQGIAHFRRLGLASHLGLMLNKPTIGCAKSLLIGKCREPGLTAGSHTPLTDKNEVIGSCLRTRSGVKPVFISIGHKIDLPTAIQMIQSCVDGFRVPRPTREVDRFVATIKKTQLLV